MKIFDVLSENEIEKILASLETANWEDGEKSVSGRNTKKKNRQISSRQEEFKLIQPFLAKTLNNEDVRSYTYMRRLIDPRLASTKSPESTITMWMLRYWQTIGRI